MANEGKSRRERGLCCSCSEPPLPGTSRCARHTEEFRAYTKARRDRLKAETGTTQPNFDAKAYSANRYKAAVDAGVCPKCRNRSACETSVYCTECLDQQRARQRGTAVKKAKAKATETRDRTAEWKQEGLCVDCGADRASKLRCRRCFALYLEEHKDFTRHEARKLAGLCQQCPKVAEAGSVYCQDHLEAKREATATAREAGNCLAHHNRPAAPGKSHCQECLDRLKDKRATRVEAGLCAECGERPPELDGRLCEPCLVEGRVKDKRKRVKLKQATLAAYGGDTLRCFCCHEGNPDLLELDHIKGDGGQQRRELFGSQSGNSQGFYRWLRDNNYPAGLQLACATCNRGKHRNGGTCPHQALPPDLLEALRDANAAIAVEVRRQAELE